MERFEKPQKIGGVKSSRVVLFVNSGIGIVLIVLAFFCLISITSYTPIDVHSSDGEITFNRGGSVGSNFAHAVLQYLGFASLLIPAHLLLWGLILFYKHSLTDLLSRLIFTLVGMLLSSFILGSIPSIENSFSFLAGGYAGYMMYGMFVDTVFFLPMYIFSIIVIGPVLFVSSGIRAFDIPNKIYNLMLGLVNKYRVTSEQVYQQNDVQSFDTREVFESSSASDNSSTDELVKNVKPENVTQKRNSSVMGVPSQSKHYYPPEIGFLEKNSQDNHKKHAVNTKNAQGVQNRLKQVLLDFGVEGEIIAFAVGPVITMYEFEPKAGVRSARVIGLAEDIARSLKARSARISIIPSKSSLAIEIPNDEREIVYLRELVESESYGDKKHAIPMCLGRDIAGKPIVVDLTKMPHLLVAGTTGSGKSIGINSMIMSILYRLSPDECKLIMIDPKMLELSVYEGIPHLMTPVVTDPAKAALTLQWITKEMEKRYKIMSKLGVRNIFNYNSFLEENRDRNVISSPSSESDEALDHKKMPYIVVIVDEMADLMLTAGKTVEASIQRLAQMARAAGIHIIMATQRPSVDVITGIIKANFPTRISFQVTSKIDSRTILGYQGAESLLGKGDMLYMPTGSKTYRIHGPFVDDKEVAKVVQYLKQNYPNTSYETVLENLNDDGADGGSENADSDGNFDDNDLYTQAVLIVKNEKKASISYVQRRLRIGYNKAANLIERMEDEGIVSSADSQGKRVVI
jgi:S-DNA-T family DNA segregation ATPase FtsK/SpoIIIE